MKFGAFSCTALLYMVPAATGMADAHEAVEAASADATDPVPGDSLYQLPITLTTADGTTLRLSDLRGEPLIITMFYTHCTSVCPLLTTQLQRLIKRLPLSSQRQVRVLMVSFDSARDTPQVLSAFRSQHHIQGSNWLVAQASSPDVRALAAALGIQFRELSDHSFSHSAVISVTDRGGTVRARTSHLSGPDEPFVRSVQAQIGDAGHSL